MKHLSHLIELKLGQSDCFNIVFVYKKNYLIKRKFMIILTHSRRNYGGSHRYSSLSRDRAEIVRGKRHGDIQAHHRTIYRFQDNDELENRK